MHLQNKPKPCIEAFAKAVSDLKICEFVLISIEEYCLAFNIMWHESFLYSMRFSWLRFKYFSRIWFGRKLYPRSFVSIVGTQSKLGFLLKNRKQKLGIEGGSINCHDLTCVRASRWFLDMNGHYRRKILIIVSRRELIVVEASFWNVLDRSNVLNISRELPTARHPRHVLKYLRKFQRFAYFYSQ